MDASSIYWEFTAVGWLQPLDPWPLLPWDGNPESSGWMRACGYVPVEDCVVGDYPWLIYAPEADDAPWRYILDLNTPGDYAEFIVIPGLVDWLAWVEKFGAAFAMLHAQNSLMSLLNMAHKTFRAWHQHLPIQECPTCDHDAVLARWQARCAGVLKETP